MHKITKAVIGFLSGLLGFIVALLFGKKLHDNGNAARELEKGNRNARETCERAGKTNTELKQSIARAKSIIEEVEKQHD